jgi:WD40 repeat protein
LPTWSAEPAGKLLAPVDRYGDPLPAGAVARLGTVRLRHENAEGVSAVAFSPDGKWLLSVGHANGWGRMPSHLRLWEVTTGKEIRRFGAPDGEDLQGLAGDVEWGFSSISLSADGRLLAAASNLRMELWDLVAGKRLRRIVDSFSAVALSPDGRILATAEENQAVRLNEVKTGKELRRLRTREKNLTTLAFSPDRRALLGVSDEAFVLWDVGTGRERRRWTHPPLVATAFSRDGTTLAGVDDGGVIRYWNLGAGKECPAVRLGLKANDGIAAAFSPDLGTVALGQDGRIDVWHLSTRRLLCAFPGHLAGVECLAFSADGKLLASGGGDRTVRLWDLTTGRELLPFAAHRADVQSLGFSPDGRLLASGCADGTVRLWRPSSGEDLGLFRQMPWTVRAVAFSPDGQGLAVAGEDPTFSLWEAATGKELRRFRGHDGSVWSVVFSPDGKQVASGDAGSTVRLWDLARGKELRRIPGTDPDTGAAGAAFSPDGNVLATVHHDRTARLWDTHSGRPLGKFVGDQKYVVSTVCLAPDGKTLAAAGDAGAVYVWDVPTGRQFPQFARDRPPNEYFGGSVIGFSPDGRLLATGGLSNPVRVWELATGDLVATFDAGYGGPSDQTLTLAFSPDGRTLATAGNGDFAILIWDMTGLLSEGRLPALKLSPAQLQHLWDDLAGAEAPVAYRAIWRLAAGGDAALAYLGEHLRPVTVPDSRRVARLLTELNDNRFVVRDRATRELEELRDAIEPDLRQALGGRGTLEYCRRVQRLLGRLEPTTPERLREDRALAALERMEPRLARPLLERLARGAGDSWLTRGAKAAQARLDKRPALAP